ncbi:glycoside hydrolase family 16 protein [Nonomuraea sp. NPDC005650]|uniref:glycoside hydrolase family 16 protein n=1 Tax=Nonomuraea sp. NPDC005650 TaxID=3157045 RepID=UPI0033A67E87
MPDQGINRRKFLASAATAGGMSLGISLIPSGAQAESSAAGRTRRAAATWENLVEKSSFNSQAAFTQSWNYLYPWADSDTHNGAAQMNAGQISLNQGVLTLKATRLSTSPGLSPHNPHAPLWYRSGAIHAQKKIIVSDKYPEYDIEGEFQTQTGPGIWPAFWTTGMEPTWPPESDILEYVGVNDQGNAVNFFNSWYQPASGDSTYHRSEVPVDDPNARFYKYRVWMYKSGTDVKLDYYFDGDYVDTHTVPGWVNVPQTLIINLQMGAYSSNIEEGDAGWANQRPGPDGDTYFRARNVWFGRTVAG